jgi:primosomal protein N''
MTHVSLHSLNRSPVLYEKVLAQAEAMEEAATATRMRNDGNHGGRGAGELQACLETEPQDLVRFVA